MNIVKVLLYDTSVMSTNQGDEIIMHYCKKILHEIFDNLFLINTATHEKIGNKTIQISHMCDYGFLCGTNLLRSKSIFQKPKQWDVGILQSFFLDDVCCLGVGWNENSPQVIDPYTKILYRNLFQNRYIHSVRDNFTQNMLKKTGISNTLMTSCPTTWNLTKSFCNNITLKKAHDVITTVTSYKQNPDKDKLMLDTLRLEYKSVYIWIQSFEDIKYLNSFYDTKKLKLIAGDMEKYTQFLDNYDVDYIGTRLHAGIHALNHGKRTLLICIDHRMRNLSKDIHLNILERNELHRDVFSAIIYQYNNREICIPDENIKKWKEQFREK